MQLVSRHVIERLSQIRVIFQSARKSLSVAPSLSRPVEDCKGCRALAGVRNAGLDDPRAGRPDAHCNFGDRRIRGVSCGCSTQRKSLERGVPSKRFGTHAVTRAHCSPPPTGPVSAAAQAPPIDRLTFKSRVAPTTSVSGLCTSAPTTTLVVRSLANHAEYGTRNREIEIWHVFGRACGSGPPHGVAVHDEFQDVDDGLTTRALQEADNERLVDAGQVPIEVIPAAPHGDKSNPNVALFPGFSPSGIAGSSVAAACHATYHRSGM